jgi:hypothetical protein
MRPEPDDQVGCAFSIFLLAIIIATLMVIAGCWFAR